MLPGQRPGLAHLLHCRAVARPSILAGLPKFAPGSFWLFVVATAASALIADQPLARDLTLNAGFFTRLELWQPLSAIVVYPEGQLGGLIGTLAIQWFIGSHLEAIWGVRRYLGLVLGAAALGYLALALLGLVVPGALVAAVSYTHLTLPTSDLV